MPWNPWIHVEDEDTSNEDARKLNAKTRNPITHQISDLMGDHEAKDILSLVEILAYQNMSTRIMESLSTVE